MSLARHSWIVTSLILVTISCSTAHAIPRARGAVDVPAALVPTGHSDLQRALNESHVWRDFQALHGAWRAVWNESTRSPHLAFGPAIPLDGYRDDASAVDRAVRRFLSRHEEIFGRPTLETMSAQRVRGVWYVSYRQTVGGAPVLFEDWSFCVSAAGGLMTFRADAHRIPSSVRATLDAGAARRAAHQGLAFDPARDRVVSAEGIFILPYASPTALEYRPVYQVQIETMEPRAFWRTLVDARTGQVLWRHDELHEVVSGHVTGRVHLTGPLDPLIERPFAHEQVAVGSTTVVTDATGAYAAPATGTVNVSSSLSGPFIRVTTGSGDDATFNQTNVADGAIVDVHWAPEGVPGTTASLDDERDAFYHVNLAHDFLKALDPNFTGIDFQASAVVDAGGSCGAFTFGTTMIFLSAGTCVATATLPDAIYHEYGHIANDRLYQQLSGFSMMNGAMHEACADLQAAFIRDDPVIARGLFGPGTSLRTLDSDLRWPEHHSVDVHTTGLILGGAFWDLRQSVGLTLATELYHFARYGLPDDPQDDGVAMSEYFLQTLVADDNDGNLGNGTPHLTQINAAFNAHGIGSGYFLTIAHAPLADQPGSGPFPVTATMRFEGPTTLARLNTASPTLYYSINGGSFLSTRMMPMGSPDQFSASIPTASASVIRYYLQASDNLGGTRSDPPGAPLRSNLFLAGSQTSVFVHDMEKNQGWTPGNNQDDATKGKWVRAEPNGTNYVDGQPLQTEFDHTTAPGTLCFVTGNGPPNGDFSVDDVDGGKTTLFTPVFSAAGLSQPVIEYFRWFVNGGRNLDEFWQVDISNDAGAHWVGVEHTNLSNPAWERVAFAIGGYLAPTSQMQMRFVAQDVVALDAIIEAAMDDFRLLTLSGGAAAAQVAGAEAVSTPLLDLRAPSPNPFRGLTRLSYAIPRSAAVELRIYDVGGRVVRWLERGVREAGAHTVAWDGLDESRQPTSSGVYYATLTFEGSTIVRRLVRLR